MKPTNMFYVFDIELLLFRSGIVAFSVTAAIHERSSGMYHSIEDQGGSFLGFQLLCSLCLWIDCYYATEPLG